MFVRQIRGVVDGWIEIHRMVSDEMAIESNIFLRHTSLIQRHHSGMRNHGEVGERSACANDATMFRGERATARNTRAPASNYTNDGARRDKGIHNSLGVSSDHGGRKLSVVSSR